MPATHQRQGIECHGSGVWPMPTRGPVRTRSSGNQVFIQLHVEMDGRQNLRAAHDIAERVMLAVEAAYPEADVLVHQDPDGIEERRLRYD